MIEDQNYLQTALYNWQTGVWDKVSLNHYALSITNFPAYVSPNGQVLLRLTNPTAAQSQNNVIFKRPVLNFIV